MEYALFRDIGIVAVVAIPFFFLIKWIAEEFKKQLERAHEQNKYWSEIINGFQKCITEHTEQAREFHQTIKETHEYQRGEHEKLAANQESVCRSLVEVEKALGRLNGYKRECQQ